LTIGDNRDRGWIVATNKPEPRLDDFVDLIIHEPHMIDFNPNRKAATKGGSMPWKIRMHEDKPTQQKNIHSSCS
jgi:hypothetical protein